MIGLMDIHISLDRRTPPGGSVTLSRSDRALKDDSHQEAGVSFSGWLGLLKVLYALVDRPDKGAGP